MNPEANPQSEPRISITYSPTIDAARDIYDSDTVVITVLDEDFEGHEGRGVPVIAIEKGKHEYPAWIQPLVQKHCQDLISSGRMHLEAVSMEAVPMEAAKASLSDPQTKTSAPQVSTVFLPYAGTPFESIKTPVSQLKSLALIPKELRMDAIEVLCSELEGEALLQHLKQWGLNPLLAPGLKTRLTKLIRKLEAA